MRTHRFVCLFVWVETQCFIFLRSSLFLFLCVHACMCGECVRISKRICSYDNSNNHLKCLWPNVVQMPIIGFCLFSGKCLIPRLENQSNVIMGSFYLLHNKYI